MGNGSLFQSGEEGGDVARVAAQSHRADIDALAAYFAGR
jgi:hypothetical protein